MGAKPKFTPAIVKVVELRNAVIAPVTNDALVEAALAFANDGAAVVIYGQPLGEVRRWSSLHEAPEPAERAAYMALLLQVIEGAPVSGLAGAGAARVSSALVATPDREGRPGVRQGEWIEYPDASVELVPVGIRRGTQGYLFASHRRFKYVASALAHAATLLMDPDRDYRNSLCRCKLPRCQRLYLAQKKAGGGRANRSYCDPRHCDEHHDSAERTAARAAARNAAARKQK